MSVQPDHAPGTACARAAWGPGESVTTLTRIARWVRPPVFEGDEEATYRASLLNAAIVTGLLMAVLVLLGNAFDSHTPTRNYFIDLAILAACLYVRHELFKGRLRLVGIVSSIAAFVVVIAVIASAGSVLVPATSLFLPIVIVAGILFGLNGVVVSSLASSLAVGGLMLAQQAGRLPKHLEAATLLHWFAFTVMFGLTGGLAYYMGQSTKRALERSRTEVRERERAEDALHAANEELHDRISQVESLQAELREQALRDALTGLYNRHYLTDALEREIQRADREGDGVSVVAMDIDHFKRVNDTFGHHVGDRVLRQVAEMLKSATRGSDFCCRSGGEEFLLVLPGATTRVAAQRAEEIRQRSEALPVAEKGQELRLTISCGVSTYPTHGRDADEILTRADEALYRSKHAGRNRVTTWERSAVRQPHDMDKRIVGGS